MMTIHWNQHNKWVLSLVVWLCVFPSEAHKTHTIHLPSKTQSVTVNEDSTVSFCYCGTAKHVYVIGDFQYTGKDSTRYSDTHMRKIKMHRQSDGFFHATTLPLQPETYTYCFRVDGKRKTDSDNNDTVWQMTHKWNIVSVGGTDQADLYLQPELEGQVIQTQWYDREEKVNRRVNIYLPAAYEQVQSTKDSFPVLYLLHGINGYEGSWAERGRAIQIIENLIAKDSINPPIIVMPDCNTDIQEDLPGHYTLWKNVWSYPRQCRDHSLELALEDLIQYIDTTYRVSHHRAIAGFSSGARIAANIANLYPDYFQAIGLFSPVVYKKQMPNTSVTNNQSPVSYHIYIGKNDMFINNGRRFHKRLTKSGIDHYYTETEGGHTWRNWRIYLTDFIIKWQNDSILY